MDPVRPIPRIAGFLRLGPGVTCPDAPFGPGLHETDKPKLKMTGR